MNGYEELLGPKHPDTLKSVTDLASLLKEQNKLNQAEALYRRALKGREEIYGSSHRDTLYTKGYLGHCLMLQSNLSGNDMIVDAFHKLKEGPNGITSSHPWYKKFTKILKNDVRIEK